MTRPIRKPPIFSMQDVIRWLNAMCRRRFRQVALFLRLTSGLTAISQTRRRTAHFAMRINPLLRRTTSETYCGRATRIVTGSARRLQAVATNHRGAGRRHNDCLSGGRRRTVETEATGKSQRQKQNERCDSHWSTSSGRNGAVA
jgi:hypothetical protein